MARVSLIVSTAQRTPLTAVLRWSSTLTRPIIAYDTT
jgi:hypothetical protein